MIRIKYIILIIIAIIFIACEKQEAVQKTNYMLHCLMVEGEAPKIIACKTLEVFPEYPFDILYYDYLNYSDELKNTEFTINIKNNHLVFNKFENIEEDITSDNNQNNWGSIPNGNTSINYLTNKEIKIKPGDNYEIQVDIYGYDYDNKKMAIVEILKAKTKIPTHVGIEVSQMPNITREDKYGDYSVSYLYYKTILDDPANEKNYYYLLPYMVELLPEDDINTLDFDSLWFANGKRDGYSDLNVNTFNIEGLYPNDNKDNNYKNEYFKGYLFSDETFDGKIKEINLLLQEYRYNSSGDRTSYAVFELYHLSEEYYRYYYAHQNQQEWKEENLYREPVQLYTNIQNGLGIFAGASLSRQIMKIESKPE